MDPHRPDWKREEPDRRCAKVRVLLVRKNWCPSTAICGTIAVVGHELVKCLSGQECFGPNGEIMKIINGEALKAAQEAAEKLEKKTRKELRNAERKARKELRNAERDVREWLRKPRIRF